MCGLCRKVQALAVSVVIRDRSLASRSAPSGEGQLAILRLGAAYAPIDLASPLARQQATLDVLSPSVVVTDSLGADPERRQRDVLRHQRCRGIPRWHARAVAGR